MPSTGKGPRESRWDAEELAYQAECEEIRFCQRLSWGAGPADSVTKANLVSG